MKKAIIPAAIFCAVLCIGLCNQPSGETEPAPLSTPKPMQVEVSPVPTSKIEIAMSQTEESVTEVTTPMPTPEPNPAPTLTPSPTPEPVATSTPIPLPAPAVTPDGQTGGMVYVEGFGWLESQGDGTVIHDDMIYENGNKVGSMDRSEMGWCPFIKREKFCGQAPE